MARPWRISYAGAKYHVTSRGNGRRKIFFGPDDYGRFRDRLQSVAAEDLTVHGIRAGLAKKVAVELCCEFTRQSQRQIGLHFGYTSDGAVGKQRQSLRVLLAENGKLSKRVNGLRKKLSK